jgi:predicted dehydrogenase
VTDKIRIGIIGAGGIAENAHVPAFRSCGDLVEIAAVASRTRERAERFAEVCAIPQVYDDYEAMLAQAELDAVVICTPNKFHAPAAIAALEAGVHVLCEKPPALTAAEALAMKEAAERAGKVLAYGFNYRFEPEVLTLKRFVEAGELGDIYAVRADALRRRGIPGWGVFTDKDLQGGGPLIDIGVHMLDTALHLMGYPEPDLVLGSTYTKLGNRPGVGLKGTWDWENYSVEDMARGMIRFQNGATLLLDTSFAANMEKNQIMNVSLMGDVGGADVFPLKIYQEKHDVLVDVTPVYLQRQNPYELQAKDFVEAILQGTQPTTLASPREGLILQRIVEALYRSAESGEAVTL